MQFPPLERLRTAVSAPAVNDDPTLFSLLTSANGPAARTAFTTGFGPGVRLATVGGWKGERDGSLGFFPRWMTSRLPAASHL